MVQSWKIMRRKSASVVVEEVWNPGGNSGGAGDQNERGEGAINGSGSAEEMVERVTEELVNKMDQKCGESFCNYKLTDRISNNR